MALAASVRPPWWRNVRVLRVVGQVIFVAVVFLIGREMYLNTTFQLDARGTKLSYGFLDTRAGFSIKEHIISYSATRDYFRAFWVAVTNAMLVAFVGIILTTILGLIIGILRLSPNWLLRKITQLYVEVIRNIPALVQVVFWYVAVILQIPRIEKSLSVFGIAYVSNRGAAIPTVRGGADFGLWGLFVGAGVIGAFLVWRWRTRVNDDTGQPSYRTTAALIALVAVAALGYLVLGDAFGIQTPELGLRNYTGGLQMSPEFAAITIGLVIYTAAFIGEIVRGSILAVSKGQKEAAEAVGLRPGQQLRFVVLPQALRIALPSVSNQYLNLWKNTSLAFLIGYPEIINILTTMTNQAGHPLEIFSLLVLTYLTVSLSIALVMNAFNRLVALKGAR